MNALWFGQGFRLDIAPICMRGSKTAFRYRDEVLYPTVRLYAATVDPDFVFMDDNVRLYSGVLVEDYLVSEGIARIELPAYSPDLNITKNLWNALCRAVCTRFIHTATLTDLKISLQK